MPNSAQPSEQQPSSFTKSPWRTRNGIIMTTCAKATKSPAETATTVGPFALLACLGQQDAGACSCCAGRSAPSQKSLQLAWHRGTQDRTAAVRSLARRLPTGKGETHGAWRRDGRRHAPGLARVATFSAVHHPPAATFSSLPSQSRSPSRVWGLLS